jgi:hypothetical protein
MNERICRFLLPAAMIALLVSGRQVSAETVPPEITVVTPRPPTSAELAGDNIATFIRAHGKPGKRIGQLGRWEKSPCPVTVGLPPALNEYVTTRIHAIESAARIPGADTQACQQQNVLIVFTTEPQAFLDDVAKKRTTWLGFHYIADIAKLKAVQHPIQAWYATATRSTSSENHLQSATASGQPEVVLDDAWTSPPMAQLGSRLSSGQQTWIVFALIVVNTTKVTGYAIGPVSDYIAMMTLQQTQLTDSCGALPSILDLLAPSCAHAATEAITAGDVAYLRALYRIDMAHELSMQRSSIEDIMMRQFKDRE